MRIGIYGGAFDPPHKAHVALAKAAIEQLNLDSLHVLPTGMAWHKTRNLTSAEHRLAMTRLAFAELAHIQVDNRELVRTGPSYTIDTLQTIKAENPEAMLYLIMGFDQAQALTTWHRWQEIVELAIICVAPRTDESCQQDHQRGSLAHIPSLQFLLMPLIPLSATQIRQKIALNQPVDALVSDTVVRYIQQHHLYRSS